MSTPTVRVDHDELKIIQNKLQAEADSIQAMHRNLQNHVDTLQRGDWIGQGAQAFYKEMGEAMMPALKRLNEALAEASKVVQQISQTMQNAENDASGALRGGL